MSDNGASRDLAGLVVDYGGVFLAGTEGWRVYSAAHFAERHGLILIIALGESIVAIGVGAEGAALDAGEGWSRGGCRRRPRWWSRYRPH